MIELIRAWLIDPTALLFMISLLFFLLLMRRRTGSRAKRSSRRSSSRSTRPRWAWPALLVWVGVFLFCTAPVFVNPAVDRLESIHPAGLSCDAGSHLIVLGGGVDSRITDASEFERMQPATMARATAAYHIAIDEPQTQIIVAGGALKVIAEAEVIAAYLELRGLERERIQLESQSKNTRENAVNTHTILQDEIVTGPIRLITSAMHMPRALSTFRQVFAGSDMELCPVSVDIQALKGVPVYALMPQTTALTRFDKLLNEVVALITYRVKGWI